MLERIYIGRRFKNDTERLEKLFALYTEMTAAEGWAGWAGRVRPPLYLYPVSPEVDPMLRNRLVLFSLFVTLGTATVCGQQERPLFDVLYADAKVGGLVVFDYSFTFLSQVTASVGYRLSPRHGIGLGYHRESYNASSDLIRFHGLGVDYRYAPPSGFILKAGGGLVLRGNSPSEGIVINEYTGGGYFLDISADYQFRSGITLGLYASVNDRAGFDEINTRGSADRSDWFLQRQYFSNWSNAGIAIGFTLPRRGRR